jgi:uncharacterized protein
VHLEQFFRQRSLGDPSAAHAKRPVRRVLLFAFTRLLIGTAVFFWAWRLGAVAYLSASGHPASAVLDRAIATTAALLTLVFVGRVIERRPFVGFGFPLRSAVRDLGVGSLVGALLLSAIIGVMALCGWYRVTGFLWNDTGGTAMTVAVAGLLYYGLVAVSEETLFRGILFRVFEDGLGTWAALVLSALIFGLAHLTNTSATVWSATAIGLEAGVLFGAAYVLTRALWVPIGLHWTWNYFEGYVYGAPVSGADQPGLLLPAITGPELWTGGAFGPEAGLIAVLLCGGLAVVMLMVCKQHRMIVAPAWAPTGE